MRIVIEKECNIDLDKAVEIAGRLVELTQENVNTVYISNTEIKTDYENPVEYTEPLQPKQQVFNHINDTVKPQIQGITN